MTASRPLVAVISNVKVPYRVHFHRRIVRELPQIRLASLFTHDQPDQPWALEETLDINPVEFGAGQPVLEQARLRWAAADWRKGGRIIDWLQKNEVRAVVIGGYNDLTRLRLISWCRRNGVPCFLIGDSNIRGDLATGVARLAKPPFVRWAVRACAGVMPCGSLGAQYFARYGARPERTYYVPYEPDYGLFSDVPESKVEQARVRYGLPRNRRRIVVCARLVHVKRVDLALDAFVRLAARRPQWDLVIVGDGPLRDDLRRLVPEDLTSRIIWTGFVGESALIAAIFAASDVLLCPSDNEPWGVVINEAAASGLAIVASDVVGAAAELIREHRNGSTFPAGDIDALSEALKDVTGADIDTLRAGSAEVLADWRLRGDPVSGLRSALRSAGLMN